MHTYRTSDKSRIPYKEGKFFSSSDWLFRDAKFFAPAITEKDALEFFKERISTRKFYDEKFIKHCCQKDRYGEIINIKLVLFPLIVHKTPRKITIEEHHSFLPEIDFTSGKNPIAEEDASSYTLYDAEYVEKYIHCVKKGEDSEDIEENSEDTELSSKAKLDYEVIFMPFYVIRTEYDNETYTSFINAEDWSFVIDGALPPQVALAIKNNGLERLQSYTLWSLLALLLGVVTSLVALPPYIVKWQQVVALSRQTSFYKLELFCTIMPILLVGLYVGAVAIIHRKTNRTFNPLPNIDKEFTVAVASNKAIKFTRVKGPGNVAPISLLLISALIFAALVFTFIYGIAPRVTVYFPQN
ncbi:MAG: hypothetical protein FWD49_02020 [Firmicutes bacterium]|nr:hypothetical protein [Bacillota bacterium]